MRISAPIGHHQPYSCQPEQFFAIFGEKCPTFLENINGGIGGHPTYLSHVERVFATCRSPDKRP
jgi:hypothetical protein